MPTKPDAAWDKFLEYAIEPTMHPDILAVLRLALLSGYLYGLADLGEAATTAHCMSCAWGGLISDATKTQAKQAAKCNALRELGAARAKLN